MMCDRVLIGVVLFQITVGGQLALKKALLRAALLIPLLVATIWFGYVYTRTYKPLMQFIALRSVRRAEHSDYSAADDDINEDSGSQQRYNVESHYGQTVDESRESGLRYINPSLIAPLTKVWITDDSVQNGGHGERPDGEIAAGDMVDGDEIA